jgi:prepilin-type N-terminal cleavage/methylation domain-containing protein
MEHLSKGLGRPVAWGSLRGMNKTNRRAGFTILEIMIVVMIITILLEIAVPNYIRSRENTRRNSCINTLKQIDGAKEEWAMDNRAPQGAAVRMIDIASAYIKGPATGPTCPGGGTYTVNPVGINPACSLSAAPGFHTIP